MDVMLGNLLLKIIRLLPEPLRLLTLRRNWDAKGHETRMLEMLKICLLRTGNMCKQKRVRILENVRKHYQNIPICLQETKDTAKK